MTTKKYSIHWEDDEIVSIEVDGVRYAKPEDISDPEDRAQVERLMARAAEPEPDPDFDQEFGPEFDRRLAEAAGEAQRATASVPKIVGGIFLAVAVLLLGIAALLTANTAAALDREASAPGRVVEVVARRDEAGRTFYYPVVEFILPDKGRQTIRLSEGSSPPAHTPGEAVTIRYDPARPNASARIDSPGDAALQWLGAGITGFVGLVFLVAALLVLRFLHPAESRDA